MQTAPPLIIAEPSSPEPIADDRQRRVTSSSRRLARKRRGYSDPLFLRPDLIEDDYYRLRNRLGG